MVISRNPEIASNVTPLTIKMLLIDDCASWATFAPSIWAIEMDWAMMAPDIWSEKIIERNVMPYIAPIKTSENRVVAVVR